MKFNSQICTSREQSERLVAMGLKPETADMMWDAITIIKGKPVQEPMWSLRPYYYPKKSGILYENEEQVFIPAWSLHRLVSALVSNGIMIKFIDNIVIIEQYKVFQKSYEFWDDVYDNICDAIEWLIKEGFWYDTKRRNSKQYWL